MTYNELERQNAPQKPCLVSTERGFSVSYKGRFLYSKYAPARAITGAIESLSILPGTLILASSPALWLGLDLLLQKLPENCFVLGIECDKELHEFAKTEFQKIQAEKELENAALLPFELNEYIANILSGETKPLRQLLSGDGKDFSLPHISNFRRAIMLEMSAGTQFSKEEYLKIASLAQNTIASFWKNRITLTRMGRLFSRNLFKNLAKLPSSVDFKNLARKITRPIIVFGAGESIEETIANVPKSEIEKCLVIAVDAACPALKAHGIKADAVVAVESQLAIEKAYIGGGAKTSLILADMTSRVQVTAHSDIGTAYFASKYTDSSFFKNLCEKEFFPPAIPPLGSVGLTAVYTALMLRESTNVPVFVTGLDFSFSLGRTHAKNAPAHIARLCAQDRLAPAENYAAAFRAGAKKITGKNGIEVFTDMALEGYAKSFADVFAGTPNLYDAGKQGVPLSIEQISSEKLTLYLGTVKNDFSAPFSHIQNGTESESAESFNKENLSQRLCETKQEILSILENEEKALNRIKELLMFGNDVASCSMSVEQELHALISPREYLFLHFPDGYKCKTSDLSFLKRVRGQIDFFLKDIQMGLRATARMR